jgi:hypothetical protein
LESHSWSFGRSYSVTIDPAGKVDWWINVPGPEPAGCAVLLADGVDPG